MILVGAFLGVAVVVVPNQGAGVLAAVAVAVAAAAAARAGGCHFICKYHLGLLFGCLWLFMFFN